MLLLVSQKFKSQLLWREKHLRFSNRMNYRGKNMFLFVSLGLIMFFSPVLCEAVEQSVGIIMRY